MRRRTKETSIPTATVVGIPTSRNNSSTSTFNSDYDDNQYHSDTDSLTDLPVPDMKGESKKSSSTNKATAKMLSSSRNKNKFRNDTMLSLPSQAYDLENKGYLNEAEQAMRERDTSARGFLLMDEIYDIVKDQLSTKKRAGRMKRLVGGLICFTIILAVSNLGTSLASAALAKDLTADDNSGQEGDGGGGSVAVPAMRISSTGKIASAQTIADVYEAVEMTEEQLYARRSLVLSEMEEDPHSHSQRRRGLLACRACRARDCVSKCSSANNAQVITFDSAIIPDEEFSVLEEDCAKQKNVYIKRRWGGSRLNERNEAICSRGVSVTVKVKKNRKNKNKKDKNKKRDGVLSLREDEDEDDNADSLAETFIKNKNNGDNRELKKNKKQKKRKKKKNREVIIEQENGRVLHADCIDGLCYIGGTILQGQRGDDCRVGATECQKNHICQQDPNPRKRMARYGTCQKVNADMTDIVPSSRAASESYCNVAKGWEACVAGYYCLRNDDDEDEEGYGGSDILVNFGLQNMRSRSNAQNLLRGRRGRNNVGDCTDDRESCAMGYGCVKTTLYNAKDAAGEDVGTWSCMYGATDGMELRSGGGGGGSSTTSSSSVGTCVATVGYGQTCFTDYECGEAGYCHVAGVIRTRSRDGLTRGICAPALARDLTTALGGL